MFYAVMWKYPRNLYNLKKMKTLMCTVKSTQRNKMQIFYMSRQFIPKLTISGTWWIIPITYPKAKLVEILELEDAYPKYVAFNNSVLSG